jgi:hypothetical protein
MRSWKLVVLGGLAFYVVTFLASFATGPIIHNRILMDTYRANAPLWRPELNQDPPDMAALMPRWITTGIIGSLLIAFVYDWVRPAFSGAGWKKGVKGAICLFLLAASFMLAYSGVFNAPDKIWAWWAVDTLILYLIGGAVLGWIGEKWAPVAST